MANYDKFDEVIRELLTGENGLMIENFDGAALKEFAEHQDVFWEGLLQYLQNENQKELFEEGYGIRQTMFTNGDVTSVIEYINDNADLIDSFLDKCLASKSSSNYQPHWNKSFEKTLEIYRQFYVDHSEIDSTNISVDDIINANAGNSFDNGQWVRPWLNVNNKNYSQVRDKDKIKRVLNDEKFLQVTHKTFTKYIRLLMPEYERVVEVEDLNRNFWVIGQVLTGILSYLFDESSPLNQLFDGMLDEITQLWENLLYLWVGFALISQELDKNDIQIIVIPVNNSLEQPRIKFDDFETGIKNLKIYWTNHLSYLKDIYTESTLVVIPEVRDKSYQENFYCAAYYPGVIIYNRRLPQGIANLRAASDSSLAELNNEKISYYPFKLNSAEEINYTDFKIDLSSEDNKYITSLYEFNNNPWGLYEESPYYYFLNDFKGQSGVPNVTYVAGIRTIFSNPEITFSDGEVSTLSIDVKCVDVVKELYDTDPTMMMCQFALTTRYGEKEMDGTATFTDTTSAITDVSKKITKGWYRGEVASYFNIIEPKFNVVIRKSWVDISDSTPPTTATIKIVGKDELGFTAEEQTKEFTINTHTDKDESIPINLAAYSGAGNLLTYTFTELPLSNVNWVCSSENTQINFNTANRNVHFTNRWTKIDFSGEAKIINKLFSNEPNTGDGQYSSLANFLEALDGSTEKENWDSYVDEDIVDMPINSARFYGARYTYHYGSASQLEITPYVTFVIKDSDGVHKYPFVYEVKDSGTVHSTGINYPYMSSVFSGAPAQSTYKLHQWDVNSNTSSENVSIHKPGTSQATSDYNTKGNLVYGDGTIRQNDNPNGAKQGLRLTFENDIPCLYNYLLLGMDRACAGVDSSADFTSGAIKNNPTIVKTLYPYYYKCEIKQGAAEGVRGIITATVVYNDSNAGLTTTDNINYKWSTVVNNRGYSYVRSDAPNEPGFTNWAQMGMGKIESSFLAENHPLLEVSD